MTDDDDTFRDLVEGERYVYLWRNPDGSVRERIRLDPSRIVVEPDGTIVVGGYKLRADDVEREKP